MSASDQIKCCICSSTGDRNVMLKLRGGRFDVLKDITSTVKSENDRAHPDCLKKIHLDKAPGSAAAKAKFKNIYWNNIRRIINALFVDLRSKGELHPDKPGESLMQHLLRDNPIENPSLYAREIMETYVDEIEQGISMSIPCFCQKW